MRPWLMVPASLVTLLIPVAVLANGGEEGFDGVVHGIEARYHVHATHVPFLGLVNFMSRKAADQGVSHLHIAEFEEMSSAIDGEELSKLVEGKIGGGWERVIRETSRKGEDQSLIYMRPEGDRMGLFVVDADGAELDVVQMSVDPGHLDESLSRYGHGHRGAGE